MWADKLFRLLAAVLLQNCNRRVTKRREKMLSNFFLFLRILAIRVGFEANSMDPRYPRKLVVGCRGSSGVRVNFAFMQYDDPNNSRAAQHSRRGVRRLRRMRDLPRTDRARLPDSHSRAIAGERGKCKEHGLRVVPRTGEFARSSWRRSGHNHQPAKIARHLFPVSPGRPRSISIAASSSGARGQDELQRLP